MTKELKNENTSASYRDELNKIMSVILNKSAAPFELREASYNLFYLCSGITGINVKSELPEDKSSTLLEYGRAISPINAALCLQDYVRTVMFMRGVYEGILEAQSRFPGEKITILYAVCGPFIPYLLGLTTKFSPDHVEFIYMDVHQRSLDAAEKIIQTLDLKDYVKEYVLADPAKYKVLNGKKPHILIIESTNQYLVKDLQAAITSNLAPQIRKNGILIPEEIIISACLADPDKEFITSYNKETGSETDLPDGFRIRKNPKRIFKLSLKNIPAVKKIPDTKTEVSVKPSVIYPAEVPVKGNYNLMLCTKVKTFNENVFSDYDSPLTMPLQIDNLLTAGSRAFIEFIYMAGREHGFKYRLVSKRKYTSNKLFNKFIKFLMIKNKNTTEEL